MEEETGTNFLKKVLNTQKEKTLYSLTELLYLFDVKKSPAEFNLELEELNIIEKKGKNWFILDFRFGENTGTKKFNNPKYYKTSFQELVNLVLHSKAISLNIDISSDLKQFT